MNDTPPPHDLRALAESAAAPDEKPTQSELVYDYLLQLRNGPARVAQHPFTLETLAALWQEARANDGVMVFVEGYAIEARAIVSIAAVPDDAIDPEEA